jgi:hypothetical protein
MAWNRPLIKRRVDRTCRPSVVLLGSREYGLFPSTGSDSNFVQAFVGESSAGCGFEVVLQRPGLGAGGEGDVGG